MTRQITDRAGPFQQGTVQGGAQWQSVREAGRLSYAEQGRLRYGAYQEDVSQGYWYEALGPDAVRVRFADGRHFYDWEAGSEKAVTHICGPDRYEGRFWLDGDHRMIFTWDVRGPRKDMRLETLYIRA